MTTRRLLLAVVCSLGAGAALPEVAAAACTDAPTHLTWTRHVGESAVTLSWQPPATGGFPAYRVYRGRLVVGQTSGGSMRVRVVIGRGYLLSVRGVAAAGPVSRCAAWLPVRARWHAPGPVRRLRAWKVSDHGATLTWSASPRGDGRLAGYRVYRGGRVVGQTRSTRIVFSHLAASETYLLSVRAADTRGALGAARRMVVRTALPPQTTGVVQAFLLETDGQSFRDLQAHYLLVGTIYPTYYDCNAAGVIVGRDDPLVTRWATIRGIAVLPRINCQSAAVLHSVLTDPTARAALIAQLESIAAGYDGLNLDFESGAAGDRAALVSFVADLAAALHAHGKKLAVEVSATTYNQLVGRAGFYDYQALSDVADQVIVMCWGLHWSTSVPGSIDDLPWTQRVTNYAMSLPNRGKFTFSYGLYGLDWASGGGPANPGVPHEWTDIRALEATHGASSTVDPVAASPWFGYVDGTGASHRVWYQDAPSLGRRLALTAGNGFGVALWRLGREDPGIWGLGQLTATGIWHGY